MIKDSEHEKNIQKINAAKCWKAFERKKVHKQSGMKEQIKDDEGRGKIKTQETKDVTVHYSPPTLTMTAGKQPVPPSNDFSMQLSTPQLKL